MIAISKIDLIDKYTKPLEVKKGRSTLTIPAYFCKKGDELEIVTSNPGSWCIVVAVFNPSNKKSFSMRWENLITFIL